MQPLSEYCSCKEPNVNEWLLGPLCSTNVAFWIREQPEPGETSLTNKHQTPKIWLVLGMHATLHVCGNGCRIKRVLTWIYRVFHIGMDAELMVLILRCLPRGCGMYRSVLQGWKSVRNTHFLKKIIAFFCAFYSKSTLLIKHENTVRNMNLLRHLYSQCRAEFKYSLFGFLLFRSNIQQFTCNSLISGAMCFYMPQTETSLQHRVKAQLTVLQQQRPCRYLHEKKKRK